MYVLLMLTTAATHEKKNTEMAKDWNNEAISILIACNYSTAVEKKRQQKEQKEKKKSIFLSDRPYHSYTHSPFSPYLVLYLLEKYISYVITITNLLHAEEQWGRNTHSISVENEEQLFENQFIYSLLNAPFIINLKVN